MKVKLSLSVFILFVLLAGSLSNTRLMSKIKTSLTNTEREFSDFDGMDDRKIPKRNQLIVASFTLIEKVVLIKFSLSDQTFKSNSSLNTLYRAHSPPTQA